MPYIFRLCVIAGSILVIARKEWKPYVQYNLSAATFSHKLTSLAIAVSEFTKKHLARFFEN